MSLKEFPISMKLGEGAYSSVYKVKRVSDEQEYALKKVKLMNLSDKEKQNALNEVRILASIRQPNIIGYKEAFVDEMSNSLCIVMEYADNGDLYQKITDYQKKGQLLPEQEIWQIFIQIVKGLKSLHNLFIFHRDLKSANVFLTKEGTVKLGDMNVSKVAKKGLLYTQTGTPYYASPEVWKDQAYDSKSDIWSLGCVLYEMTTLKPPFRAEDMEGLYKKVIRGYYPRIPPHFSQDLANIIRSLLQVSPHLRPSCDKILSMPAVIKRMQDHLLTEVDEFSENNNLLNTIKVPKNLHYLTDRLPKPNYQPLKTKKIDRKKFLQTLAGYSDIPQIETPSPEQMKQLVLPKIPNIQQKKKINDIGNTSNEQRHKQSQQQQQQYEEQYQQRSQDQYQSQMIDDSQSMVSQQSQQQQEQQLQNPPRANPRSRSRKPQQHNKYDPNAAPSVSPYGNYDNDNNNGRGVQQQKEYQQPKGGSISNKPIDLIALQEKYDALNEKNNVSIHQNDKSALLSLGNDRQHSQISMSPSPQLIKMKKDLSPIKKKKALLGGVNNLLDIEGESKPLVVKSRKVNPEPYLNAANDQNRLPSLNGKSILNNNNNSNNNRLPRILNGVDDGLSVIGSNNGGNGRGSVGITGARLDMIDNAKIKEISRAYKVNLDPLTDLKDRYRQLKRNDRSKLTSLKNASLPANNGNSLIDANKYMIYSKSPQPGVQA